MTTLAYGLLAIAVWTALSLPLAVLVGRIIAAGSRHLRDYGAPVEYNAVMGDREAAEMRQNTGEYGVRPQRVRGDSWASKQRLRWAQSKKCKHPYSMFPLKTMWFLPRSNWLKTW